MSIKFDNILDNKWWQEIAVVGFSFTIYTLKNDWMLFSSLTSVLMGIFFYFILYMHAQFNRFFLLLETFIFILFCSNNSPKNL